MNKILKAPLLILMLALCNTALFAQKVTYDDWKNLTTSGKLPPECKIQRSNNNLDLVKFKGRYYLAFPDSAHAFCLQKIKDVCGKLPTLIPGNRKPKLPGKRFEGTQICSLPRYLKPLFFYRSTNKFKFDPQQLLVCRTLAGGTWTKPESVNLDGFVPWRIRERKGTLYLSAYYGKNCITTNTKATSAYFTALMPWRETSFPLSPR